MGAHTKYITMISCNINVDGPFVLGNPKT